MGLESDSGAWVLDGVVLQRRAFNPQNRMSYWVDGTVGRMAPPIEST